MQSKATPSFWTGLKEVGKEVIAKIMGIKKRDVKAKTTNVAGSYLTSKETKIAKLNEAGN